MVFKLNALCSHRCGGVQDGRGGGSGEQHNKCQSNSSQTYTGACDGVKVVVETLSIIVKQQKYCSTCSPPRHGKLTPIHGKGGRQFQWQEAIGLNHLQHALTTCRSSPGIPLKHVRILCKLKLCEYRVFRTRLFVRVGRGVVG